MIELSEQQSQALRGASGRPVDVVDPGTRRRYVLLSQEQYERARPLLAGAPEEQAPAAEVAAAEPLVPEEPPAYEGGAERIRLRDLPTPPEVTEDAQRFCRKNGRPLRPVEEQLKLEYYYGGQLIFVIRSKEEGPVVVPIPERHFKTEGLRYVLLTPEERHNARLITPARWRDDATEILTG